MILIHWHDEDFVEWARGYINRVTTFAPVFRQLYPLILRELGQNFIRGAYGTTQGFTVPWQQLTRLTGMQKTKQPRQGILRVTGKLMRSVSSGSGLRRTIDRISMTIQPRDSKAGMLIKTHHKGATWTRPMITARHKKAIHFRTISGINIYRHSAKAIRITRPARPIMTLSSQFLKDAKRFIVRWVVGRVRAGDIAGLENEPGHENVANIMSNMLWSGK